MPMFRSICSAVRGLVTTASTLRRPPHGHAQTSTSQVRRCRLAQSSRGLRGAAGGGSARAADAGALGGVGRAGGELGLSSSDGSARRVTRGRNLAWEANTQWKEVRWNFAGGHQHDEATHQLLGAQHQHGPSLGGVLVASVLPSRQPRLGNWPSRTIPGESLHALSVVGVDPRVGVQREALSHRHPPVLRQRSDLGEGHVLLHPLVLKGLQAVFGPQRLLVLEDASPLPQQAPQHCSHVRLLAGRQLDEGPSRAGPQAFRHQHVQMR